MSTLDICDRVMIIIDGKLQAFDTIDHLTEHNTYYRTASKIAGTGMLPESDSFPGVPAAGV
jgi:ATP-binding cassette subfamily B protein